MPKIKSELCIYCFGNEFIKTDSLAKKLVSNLVFPNIKFINCSSPDDLPESNNLIILDVIMNISKSILITDIDHLSQFSCIGCHDLDLSFWLKLKKEMGELKKIQIIGIPPEGNRDQIQKELTSILSKLD
ncbi:hypothetical protein HN587_05180 [Candidatus Woesearchaeota archaeon]|nr:hypothetical protein [Candidatus Woesearchaeota archaeon]